MNGRPSFPSLLESFFRHRMAKQRNATSATIASYGDALRMLILFAADRARCGPPTNANEANRSHRCPYKRLCNDRPPSGCDRRGHQDWQSHIPTDRNHRMSRCFENGVRLKRRRLWPTMPLCA